jgi:hypothetical protein
MTLRAREIGKPKEWTIFESITEWFFGAPSEYNEPVMEPWMMTDGFFVQMGGFLLREDGKPVQVLNYARLKRCIGDGTIDPPDITAEEIQDRAKGDFISKGLVILQTSWFILQCLARWSQKLTLSELEVVTLGLALLNGITYALWWNKPQGVGKAFRIPKKKAGQNSNDNPPVSESEKEPTDSGNIESPAGGPPSEMPTNLIAPTVIQVDKLDVELLSAFESPITGDAPTEKD